MEHSFFRGGPITLFGTFQTPDQRVGKKNVDPASEHLASSLASSSVQWSQSQMREENASGKKRLYELSKAMKEKCAFLALTQMPITPCR